jgi:hypothetical protein
MAMKFSFLSMRLYAPFTNVEAGHWLRLDPDNSFHGGTSRSVASALRARRRGSKSPSSPYIPGISEPCIFLADRVKTLFYSGDWRRVTRGGAFCAFWPGKPPVNFREPFRSPII